VGVSRIPFAEPATDSLLKLVAIWHKVCYFRPSTVPSYVRDEQFALGLDAASLLHEVLQDDVDFGFDIMGWSVP
jgi:hypothetical protein